MSSISRRQIQLIHIAKSDLGMSDEDYRELLMTRYPGCFEGSCKELTEAEADDLLEHFKARGFKVKRKRRVRPRRPPVVTDMITRGQRAKVKALAGDIQWHAGESKGLRGFCRRQLGVDYPRTEDEAQRFIEHLKYLKASQQRKASGSSDIINQGGRNDKNS